jgi:hypothetical protein
MTIIKIKEIADYINNYINERENTNYRTFPYFRYNNFHKILSNLLNATYHKESNLIIIYDYVIVISEDKENDKYEIYITEKYLMEPKGPI